MWWPRAFGRALDPQGGEGPVHARKPKCLSWFERLAGGRRSVTDGRGGGASRLAAAKRRMFWVADRLGTNAGDPCLVQLLDQ